MRPRWLVLSCLLLLLVASGCGVQATPVQPTATPTTGMQQPVAGTATIAVLATMEADSTITAGQIGSAITPTTATGAGTYQNPVIKDNFPDPSIMNVSGVFYAYATNGLMKNVQVARSSDLVHWEMLPDALPVLPAWASPESRYTWAPEVIPLGGRYVLYYTARDVKSDKQCIGVATSDSPEGKFKDESSQPLVCQAEEGGSIDPAPFEDAGKFYLYWKNDGNCCFMDTHLYAQELAPDGLSLVGQPARLESNDKAWEGGVVEAPTMFKHENAFYLFYSGNKYDTPDYAVGYASCKSPTGPCEDAPENPVLKTVLKSPPVYGPGHQALVQVGGETWIAYHVWELSAEGVQTDRRFMYIDRVEWKDGKPLVSGPTTDAEPAPMK